MVAYPKGLLAFLLCLFWRICLGDNEESFSVKSIEELKKMPIKQLKAMLDERGLACKGCSEKDEYIKLVNDNQHLPVKEKVVVEETKEKKPVDQAKLDKEMEDLQGMLKGFGGGGAKIFTAKDFEGLSPEELADKFSGSSKSKKSNKSSKKAKKPAEPKKSKFAFPKHSDSDSEENIEL